MYCSISDILTDLPRNEVINLANDENRLESAINLNSGSDVLVVRVNTIISSAEEQINMYLRSRYTLPLTTVPARVKKYAVIISIYNLYLRRFPVETPYSKEYSVVIAELKDIQRGLLSLDFPETDANSDTSGNYYVTNKASTDRVFTDTLLEYYQ